MKEESLRTGFDPNDRELCPDGGCIGVIGVDGRCAECGKASLKRGPSATKKPPRSDKLLVSDSPDDTKAAPDHPREVEGDAFDPDRRELCPDGACVGVIGIDGRCVECGKASDHGPRSAGLEASAPIADDDDDDDKTERASPHESAESAGTTDDSQAFEERQLCPDGACIGVIGSNGRCKSCGTRAE